MEKKRILSMLAVVMVCIMTIMTLSVTAFAAENKRVTIDPESTNISFNDAQWQYYELYFTNGIPVTLQYFIDNPDASITINGYRNINMHIGENNLAVNCFGNNPSTYRLTNSNVKDYIESNPDADLNATLSVANASSDGGNISFELNGVELPEKPNPILNAIKHAVSSVTTGSGNVLGLVIEQPILLFYVGLAIVGAIVLFAVILSKRV